jgi:hypothetical protein
LIGGERAIQGERMILRLAMAVERVFEGAAATTTAATWMPRH